MSTLAGASAANSERLLRSANAAPPFSPILNRLLANLAQENVMLSEVSDLIQKDTVLAGSLLRTVNSAAYGMMGQVNSVQHALAIMGLDRARNLVLTMSFMGLWGKQPAGAGWSASRFNQHATAAAILADLLVERVASEYPEGAFAAGLLHDFGKLLMANELPAEYAGLRARVDYGGEDRCQVETELFGVTHAELAAAALRRWNLPEPIVEAVRGHHNPPGRGAGPLPLAAIVACADRAVNRLGIHVAASHPEASQPPEETLEPLGLGGQAAALWQEFDREFAAAKSFFR